VPAKLFVSQFILSIVAIVIISFGLMVSGVGDTLELKYGAYLDRMAVFVMIGTLIMGAIPAYIVVKEKAWLRLGALIVLLVSTAPGVFPVIMGIFAALNIAKPLGSMGFPILFAMILHAVLAYWIGFQGVVSTGYQALQRAYDMRRHDADNAHAHARPLQATADQGNLDVKSAKKVERDAEKALKKAQENTKAAREAHEKFLKQDTTVSDAEDDLKLRQYELDAREASLKVTQDQLKKGPYRGVTLQQLQDDNDKALKSFRDFQRNEYRAAQDALNQAKLAIERSSTGRDLKNRENEEQQRSDDLRKAKDDLATAEKAHALQVKTAGAAARAAEAANQAAQVAKDRLETAQKNQAGQRLSWGFFALLLFVGMHACYSAAWGAILLRV
jgi:hypothetical protein